MSEINLPAPGAENQINNPPGNTQLRKKLQVSRRDFLRFGSAAGIASFLTACGWPPAEQDPATPPTNTPTPTDLKGMLPTSPQETTPASEPQATASSSEPTPAPDKPFYTKEIDPETGIEIISKKGQFLTKEEFNLWSETMRKTGEYLSDPKNRTTAFLIGHKAWDKWNKDGILDGEKPLAYLKRHAERLNYAISHKTRETSGINDLRFSPLVVLVDDDWLKGLPYWVRQFGNSDTFGRWSWDLSYKPGEFLGPDNTDKLTGKKYDDLLFHELWHHSFYNAPHIDGYFRPEYANWIRLLHENFQLGQIGNLRIWDHDQFHVVGSWQLQLLTYALNINADYILSEPDELLTRRNLLSALPPYTRADQVGSTDYFRQLLEDLSPEYAIDFGQRQITFEEMPILYKAWLKGASQGDKVEWVFDEKSQNLPCRIQQGKVILPNKLISKFMVDASGNDSGLGCAYVLKVGERFYGFTNYHLYYWHWREQLKNGEQKIGKFGKAHPVSVPIEDWK